MADPGQDTRYWKAYNLWQSIVATYGGRNRDATHMHHNSMILSNLQVAE